MLFPPECGVSPLDVVNHSWVSLRGREYLMGLTDAAEACGGS